MHFDSLINLIGLCNSCCKLGDLRWHKSSITTLLLRNNALRLVNTCHMTCNIQSIVTNHSALSQSGILCHLTASINHRIFPYIHLPPQFSKYLVDICRRDPEHDHSSGDKSQHSRRNRSSVLWQIPSARKRCSYLSLKAHSHNVRLTRACAAEVCIAAKIEKVLLFCTAPVCHTHMCQTHIVWMGL